MEIYEFEAIHKIDSDGLLGTSHSDVVQIASGMPIAKHTTAGEKTMNKKTNMIKISGSGTITWSNGIEESFDGTEFRGIKGGATLIKSA